MSKPLLFLFSSTPKLENIYYLKDVGATLNLLEAPIDLVSQYLSKDFIICNMRDVSQTDKLRYIDLDQCTKVAVLRQHESITEPWLERLQPDYKVKSFSFVDQCKTKDEILNVVKVKNVFKMPDHDVTFWAKKFAFLLKCFRASD